jgi:hypothetical protein
MGSYLRFDYGWALMTHVVGDFHYSYGRRLAVISAISLSVYLSSSFSRP